jgi:hypothetical protein
MKLPRMLATGLVLLAFYTLAYAQTWTKLTHQPTVNTDTALLLTDGRVMMHQYNSTAWWALTPDNTGSYLNGTWTQLGSMQSGYEPLYFASAVLSDGRVLVEGGEYNNLSQVETNKGSIYNPATNTWTAVSPPSGWSTIGDSPAIVLPNGTFMMGQGGSPSTKQVNFNATTLTWTAVGTGKADGFSEEGFALLPDGNVLNVDTEDGTNSELYNPSTAKWTSAGSTLVTLPNSGGLGIVPELGPLMQRPNGSVVAFGATTNTAIYSPTGTWAAGPTFPNSDDIADGNASILQDGNILVYTSPGVFSGTGTFYEFTYPGNTFVTAPATATSGTLESWDARQLLLPTGQVMWMASNGSTIDVELYTPTGTYQAAWQPTISSVASSLAVSSTNNAISGKQFNGLDAGTAYGDDAQMATNYPLVRIKNNSTGHVFYCKTHNHSTMGIATGTTTVSTEFDIPSTVETGASTIVVVANGIPSAAVAVTITAAPLSCTPAPTCGVEGTAPNQVIAGGITVSCNQATLLTVSATICGSSSCTTNSAAPPQPVSSLGEGGSSAGAGGSCSYTWTWGGNSYNQTISEP